MSTPGGVQYTTMSTSGSIQMRNTTYQDACGGYHEYTGGCSVHQRDTMSTSGISVQMRKSHDQISRIFVLAPFATMQLYMLAFGTSDSLL